MAKGIIKIEVFKDRLRLRWSTSGDRYCIYIGLPDTKINRSAAEAKARQIELDIVSGNFDRTLKKYKPEVKIPESRITVADLFEKYCEHKAKVNEKPTQVKYLAVLARLREFFDKKLVEDLTAHECEQFLIWLEKYNAKRTIKDRLSILKACWQWNNEKNVWEEVAGKVKVPPQQKPKPFTREEITMIITAFRGDRYYKPYADYVEFLFGTGCRTGEVIGLRWKHLSDDCSTAWIGESFVRGTRKATKTNRDRVITLTPRLQKMILERRPENFVADDFVFKTPNGKPIDDNNFRNRAWNSILTKLGIDYRKPYNTRHTLISHALDMGMNPVMVAQMTGHDVGTLYDNYAGSVNSRPRLPELHPV